MKYLLILCAVLVSACGGGGLTSPSLAPAADAGLLEGTWVGTITFTKPTPRTVPTTWTFHTIPLTAGHGFNTTATWMGITTHALTASSVGTQFSANGAYPSPFGCDGLVGGLGTADARTIDSTFSGSSSCDSVFEGHLRLTR